MSFSITGRLTGLSEAFASLEGLKRGMRNTVLRKALDRGTKPILDDARDRAPKETGLLARSLGRVVRTYRGTVVVVIGPRHGFKEQVVVSEGETRVLSARKKKGLETTADTPVGSVVRNRDAVYYAHLVEFGHAGVTPHDKKALSSGAAVFAHAGPAAPRPFLRPAWDSKRDAARGLIAQTVREELAKLVAKGKA